MITILSTETKRLILRSPLQSDLPAINDCLSNDRISFIGGTLDDVGKLRTRSAALAKRLSATFEKNHYFRKYECRAYRHPAGGLPQKATQSETN